MARFEHGKVRIYYEDEGGDGVPALVIPGLTMSIDDMDGIRKALAGRYRVIAADAPGSGRSEPIPRHFEATYYHDDAESFLALLASLGLPPAHIVGFSDGGEYALVMAELKPEAVRSIVAWGSVGIAPPQPMLQMFGQVIDNPIPPMQEYSDYLKSTYGEENARTTIQSVVQAFAGLIESGGDISRNRASEIACPALLITGENDPLASPPAVADLAKAIPQGEFVEFKGAGHTVHHDQPDSLISTVVDWLAKH